MVYNAASYRQWVFGPLKMLRRLTSDPAAYVSCNETDPCIRGAYDSNLEGGSAPQTEFVTRAEFKHLARAFSRCTITPENIGVTSFSDTCHAKSLAACLAPISALTSIAVS